MAEAKNTGIPTGPTAPPAWWAQLEEIDAILNEARAARTAPHPASLRAVIEDETAGCLSPAAVARLADRVADLLAS